MNRAGRNLFGAGLLYKQPEKRRRRRRKSREIIVINRQNAYRVSRKVLRRRKTPPPPENNAIDEIAFVIDQTTSLRKFFDFHSIAARLWSTYRVAGVSLVLRGVSKFALVKYYLKTHVKCESPVSFNNLVQKFRVYQPYVVIDRRKTLINIILYFIVSLNGHYYSEILYLRTSRFWPLTRVHI